MKTSSILFIVFCLLSITQSSYSGIYKWIDKNGNVQFTDKKPQQGNKIEHIKLKVNTISNDNLPLKTVTIYSASWCGVCKQAKKYFKQHGIPYKEYDIEKSAKGRNDFKRLRGRGVPIIIVGKQRLDGFDVAAFERIFKD